MSSSRPRSKAVIYAEAESANDRLEGEGVSPHQQQFKHKDISSQTRSGDKGSPAPPAGTADRPTERQVEAAKRSPSGDDLRVVDETINAIVRAHLSTTNYTTTTVEQGLSLYEALTIGHDDVSVHTTACMTRSGFNSSNRWR